jgi:predicted enzyme related to lactoylglutathione lyase
MAPADFMSSFSNGELGRKRKIPPTTTIIFSNHDEFLGGIPGAPPHWQIYVLVSDCEGVATKAKCLGAKFYMPPMKIEDIGRMAVMADPQSAAFAIFEAARQ